MYHPSEFKCIATQKQQKQRILFGKRGFNGDLPKEHFDLFQEIVRQFGLNCTIDQVIKEGPRTKIREVTLLVFMSDILQVPPAKLLDWIARVKTKFESLGSEDELNILDYIASAKKRLQPAEETLKQLLILKSLDNPRKTHQQIFDELHERVWTLGDKAQNTLALAFDKIHQSLSLREGFNVSS